MEALLRRFPNLDKVLPLPPANLPPWSGDRDTLVNAARGVSHPQPAPKSPTAYSERTERFHLDAAFLLAPSGETTTCTSAPFAGYWQPTTDGMWMQQGGAALATHPALSQPGERFDRVFAQNRDQKVEAVPNLTWLHWRTVRHDEGTVAPPVVRGRTREIEHPTAANICSGDKRCPVSGTWQPWMRPDHPMQTAVNQYWRQAWIVAGQRFPDPPVDWKLDVPADDVIWHLMDNVGIDICRLETRAMELLASLAIRPYFRHSGRAHGASSTQVRRILFLANSTNQIQ
jgi:hypothetical protein